jgi:hypothetical protein
MMPSFRALATLLAAGATVVMAQAPVTIRVDPAPPLIERSACCQFLNFDFLLESSAADTMRITRIDLQVFDRTGTLISRRHVSGNGMLPSIGTLSVTRIPPRSAATLYNPLFAFDRGMDLHELRFDFRFASGSGATRISTAVRPKVYLTKTPLTLPLAGRILVSDGHDYYSHHRRLDLVAARAMNLVKRQFNRYAYDLVIVDEAGTGYRTDGRSNEDWLGYGAPVYAPGGGVVRDAVNDAPEHRMPNDRFEFDPANPRAIPGNFVAIDHGNGECSFMAHLKRGTVLVKPGDRVRPGQVIGAMGLSGDSDANAAPHVHYQLMDGCDFTDADGLPSYWSGFVRVGAERSGVTQGQIDTGDIVIVRERPRPRPGAM